MSDWFEAERHAERAHQFFENGQWDSALDELRMAIDQNPNKYEWHYGMGMTLDAMERHEEAIEAYYRALSLEPGDLQTMLNLAVDLIRIGKPQRSVSILEDVEKIDSTIEASYCHRIMAYAQLGDHDKAEEMFYLARQFEEDCPVCYDHLALSLMYRSEFKRAIWCWQQVLKMEPHYPGVRGNLARVHQKLGHFDRARRLFLRQLRLDPGDVDTLLQLAYLLCEMRLDSEAAEKLRHVIELDPTIPEAHAELGLLALKQGHLDAAGRRLRRAKRLDPQRPGVHLGLAKVAMRLGERSEARDYLFDELENFGQTVEQLLDMAGLFIKLEMPEEALDSLVTLEDGEHFAIEEKDLLVQAYLYRGISLLMIGDQDGGMASLKHCLMFDKQNTDAMRNLVIAYLDRGDLIRGKAWLRKLKKAAGHDRDVSKLSHRYRRMAVRSWWRTRRED
ncbi:tetratricopeptide repeat protein [Poriferisphaera sp. WC338]|uniref:tetratricopeptide repeat protein n=1 Tax=Poriferisphaera sp. WC338 TaxID=3425129 RepID=UPI003D8166CA